MKACTKCMIQKPNTEFYEKQSWCKNCQRMLSVSINRKKYTGCTPEEFDNLYIKQKGCCAICGKHASEFDRSLAADHCHDSKKIRGLLCGSCNQGLGYFKDNQSLLLEAVAYLNRSQ